MKFSKLMINISIVSSLLVGGISRADTCYDPNYNRYYHCNEEEYIAPVIAGLLLAAVIANSNFNSNDNDDYHGYDYHHRYHYRDRHRGYDGHQDAGSYRYHR
jgi:hypothetical protein